MYWGGGDEDSGGAPASERGWGLVNTGRWGGPSRQTACANAR